MEGKSKTWFHLRVDSSELVIITRPEHIHARVHEWVFMSVCLPMRESGVRLCVCVCVFECVSESSGVSRRDSVALDRRCLLPRCRIVLSCARCAACGDRVWRAAADVHRQRLLGKKNTHSISPITALAVRLTLWICYSPLFEPPTLTHILSTSHLCWIRLIRLQPVTGARSKSCQGGGGRQGPVWNWNQFWPLLCLHLHQPVMHRSIPYSATHWNRKLHVWLRFTNNMISTLCELSLIAGNLQALDWSSMYNREVYFSVSTSRDVYSENIKHGHCRIISCILVF